MNLHPSSASAYAIPDLNKIRTCQAAMRNEFINLRGIYLPRLQGKLRELESALNFVDTSIQNALMSAPPALQTDDIKGALEALLTLDKQDANPVEPSVRKAYTLQVTTQIVYVSSRIEQLASDLVNNLEILTAFDAGQTEDFVTETGRKINARNDEVTGYQQEYARIDSQKEQLSAAMRIYEDKNLIDEYVALLDIAKNINPASAQMSAITAAVDIVKHALGIISSAVKYKDLADARRRLQTRLDDLSAKERNLTSEIKTLESRNQQLIAYQTLDDHKTQYAQEVRKVADALLSIHTEPDETSQKQAVEYTRAFIAQSEALAAYLKDLNKRWK